VIVFFDKEGKVARWEGGNLPTEKEYIARIAGPAPKIKKDLRAGRQAGGNTAPIPASSDNAAASPVGVTISNDKK
jgi:outer membrane protein assembly factor BamE